MYRYSIVKKSILFFVTFLVVCSFSLHAQIRLEGYFESVFGTKYESDSFNWNVWDPDFKVEFRLFAHPIANSEAYVKFYGDKWNEHGQMTDHSEAILAEAHLSYRQELNGRGFNAVLFSRENNHYWTDGSLLNVLNSGSVNNDGNGQGVRFDLWEPWGGSATYVFSDFSQGDSDDIHLVRLRQNFLKNKLRTGMFYQRKNYGIGDKNSYNQVFAFDEHAEVGNYQINFEMAFSSVPSEQEIKDTLKYYRDQSSEYFKDGDYISGLREFFKGNVAAKMEFRGFRIGTPKIGYWFINPGVWTYGKCYRNYMGDNKSDEYGIWVNSYYFVPQRAITFTLNYWQHKKLEGEEYPTGVSLDPVTNLYAEAYIEFVNGFKGKVYYNKKDEVWHGKEYKHNDFFAELSVENRLAKLLTQFKIKDIGETWEKQIAGIECAVNLSDRWRAFARGLVVNDRVGSRMSFFGELQYRIGGNSELYLQYGPSWYGGYGLVNDDSFVSGGTMQDEIRVVFKAWF